MRSPVTLLLMLSLVVGACGGEGSDEDPAAELHAKWVSTNGVYLSFDEDGSWGASLFFTGLSEFNWGTYTFDGETLTLFTEEPVTSNTCNEGETGIYETTFTDEGNLILNEVEDQCRDRAGDLEGELTRSGSG